MLSNAPPPAISTHGDGRTSRASGFATVIHRTYLAWIRLARSRRTCVLGVTAGALLLGYIYHVQCGFPEPEIHDEFSYLLAADTFASGRVTNPPHPLWTHFESMHILQQPTYASIYPVGQGLLLAAAKRVTGHPWWGVWFSIGLMCGAICWMLQQWVPPQWALVGGLLSLRIVISYWLRSYWGGAIAAIAGALLLGAAARMLRRPAKKWAFLMALAIAVLANTRPYEGLVLTLCVAGWYLVRLVRMPAAARAALLGRITVPFAVVFIAAGGGMAYYNWRVTGSPLTLPYSVSFRTYLYRRMFIWQKDRPHPFYRHPIMQETYAVLDREEASRLQHVEVKLVQPLVMYFGVLSLLCPLTFLAWWSRRTRPLVVFSAVTLAALALEYWSHPHYSAPAAAAMYGVMIQTIRRVNAWARWGAVASRLLIATAILGSLVQFAVRNWNVPEITSFSLERARIQHQLETTAVRNLVIVRYARGHDTTHEWVYNRADIDRSPVVWARDVSLPDRMELIRYFKDRKVWILEPDHFPQPWLRPYTPCEQAGPRFAPAAIAACY